VFGRTDTVKQRVPAGQGPRLTRRAVLFDGDSEHHRVAHRAGVDVLLRSVERESNDPEVET